MDVVSGQPPSTMTAHGLSRAKVGGQLRRRHYRRLSPIATVTSTCRWMRTAMDHRSELSLALDTAKTVGVDRVVQIGCDVAGAGWAVAAAERDRRVVAGVALHPNEAPRLAERHELPDGARHH